MAIEMKYAKMLLGRKLQNLESKLKDDSGLAWQEIISSRVEA